MSKHKNPTKPRWGVWVPCNSRKDAQAIRLWILRVAPDQLESVPEPVRAMKAAI